jgi:PQQ-dependent catabolism-associated CXXCW motif protein
MRTRDVGGRLDRGVHGLKTLITVILFALAIAGTGVQPAAAAEQGSGTGAPAEPSDYRTDNYRSPTPTTLAGAKVVSAFEAMALWRAKAALFIDVLPSPHKPANLPADTLWHAPERRNIAGSVWLPNTGYGVLGPPMLAYFRNQLQRLSAGDKAAPLLFYCLKDCWMSWNAAKRAIAFGYKNVYWFPDGTDGWAEAGGALAPCLPAGPLP